MSAETARASSTGRIVENPHHYHPVTVRWATRAELAHARDAADALARVLAMHYEGRWDGEFFGCLCGWDNGTTEHNDGYREHLAAAILSEIRPDAGVSP